MFLMQAVKTWQLQEAKTHFSRLIKEAAFLPQPITLRGEPVAIVISMAEYRQLTKPKKNLSDILRSAPVSIETLELPKRKVEKMREVSI
jgi:prevent-host-death family protein